MDNTNIILRKKKLPADLNKLISILSSNKSFSCNRKFTVMKLTYRFGFKTVFVDTIYCRDIGIAKSAVPGRLKNRDDVFVLVDFHGVYHYYHPRFKVWYKNFTDVQLRKYFHWLLPEVTG